MLTRLNDISLFQKRWFIFIAGAVLAALVIFGIRFATYSIEQTHYHANFAVYINGQREEFKDKHYYEEIAACTADGPIQPAQRAHMHENLNNVLHVHDDGTTWEQFFNNLGWSIGSNYIQTYDHTIYQANETDKLNIVLNGQNLTDLTAINNEVIKDEDRLLVSFGAIDDATLDKEYKTVPATAHKYDITPDPASCAGQMKHVTISDRFKHLL